MMMTHMAATTPSATLDSPDRDANVSPAGTLIVRMLHPPVGSGWQARFFPFSYPFACFCDLRSAATSGAIHVAFHWTGAPPRTDGGEPVEDGFTSDRICGGECRSHRGRRAGGDLRGDGRESRVIGDAPFRFWVWRPPLLWALPEPGVWVRRDEGSRCSSQGALALLA